MLEMIKCEKAVYKIIEASIMLETVMPETSKHLLLLIDNINNQSKKITQSTKPVDSNNVQNLQNKADKFVKETIKEC